MPRGIPANGARRQAPNRKRGNVDGQNHAANKLLTKLIRDFVRTCSSYRDASDQLGNVLSGCYLCHIANGTIRRGYTVAVMMRVLEAMNISLSEFQDMLNGWPRR